MISGHVAAVRCGLVVRLQVRAIRARTSILSVAPYASDVLVSDTWWSEGGHRLGLLDSRKRDGGRGLGHRAGREVPRRDLDGEPSGADSRVGLGELPIRSAHSRVCATAPALTLQVHTPL
jgi:hypothetical protein